MTVECPIYPTDVTIRSPPLQDIESCADGFTRHPSRRSIPAGSTGSARSSRRRTWSSSTSSGKTLSAPSAPPGRQAFASAITRRRHAFRLVAPEDPQPCVHPAGPLVPKQRQYVFAWNGRAP